MTISVHKLFLSLLLALAMISVVPHSYVNARRWFHPEDMNIFFLLFLGLVTIYAYDWLKEKISQKPLAVFLQIVVIAASCAIAVLCNFEYGMMGILLIMVFYIFRNDFPRMALFGILVMSAGYMANVILRNGGIDWIQAHSQNLMDSILNTDKIQIFGLLAFPLIYLYNGKKGRQLPKAFYYLYYPVHLGILALILYL